MQLATLVCGFSFLFVFFTLLLINLVAAKDLCDFKLKFISRVVLTSVLFSSLNFQLFLILNKSSQKCGHSLQMKYSTISLSVLIPPSRLNLFDPEQLNYQLPNLSFCLQSLSLLVLAIRFQHIYQKTYTKDNQPTNQKSLNVLQLTSLLASLLKSIPYLDCKYHV